MSINTYEGPEFDELHSVSDLHIGGEPDFQIFKQTDLLAQLILSLIGERPPGHRVGLVLNGDVVDFLAQDPHSNTYFDPERSLAKLESIARNFAPVFKALGQFLRTPGRTLFIAIGNHDIELALPHMQEALITLLCEDDRDARARLVLVSDGTGIRARVGGKRVLFLHGNEVDNWNYVPPLGLQSQVAAAKRGTTPPDWTPNAGTKLVIDVMNDVKRKFAFVDLLKPEKESVVGVVLALDPNLASRIPGLLKAAGQAGINTVLRRAGFLGEDSEDGESPAGRERPPSVSPRDQMRRRNERARQLQEVVETAQAEDVAATQLAEEGELLGRTSIAVRRVFGMSTKEDLRTSLLEWTTKDQGFDISAPDDTSRKLDQLVSPDIDFLIAGHTHLAKSLDRSNGRGQYFNTGTWARLIHLKKEWLEKPVFDVLYETLKTGTMEALDNPAAKDLAGLVELRPTVVSIFAGASPHGELRIVRLKPDGKGVDFEAHPAL